MMRFAHRCRSPWTELSRRGSTVRARHYDFRGERLTSSSTRVNLMRPEPPRALGTIASFGGQPWKSLAEPCTWVSTSTPRRRLRAGGQRSRGRVAGSDRNTTVRHRQVPPAAPVEGRAARARLRGRPVRVLAVSAPHSRKSAACHVVTSALILQESGDSIRRCPPRK